jgi:hypothetical protein
VLKPSKDNPLVPARVTQEALFPPRKPRFDHVYADLYFDSDLQAIFDGEKELMEEKGLEVDSFLLRNKVINEAWARAPDELKKSVRLEVDKRHEEAMQKYRDYVGERPSDANLVE